MQLSFGAPFELPACRTRLTPPLTKYRARRAKGRTSRAGDASGFRETMQWQLSRSYAPNALSVLDVGAYDPSFISSLDWIPTKLATDLRLSSAEQRAVWNGARGVAFVKGDFLTMDFGGTRFDLVTCNQVIEHLPHPLVDRFVRKLMSVARTLVVATTLELPQGVIKGHVQDPIGEDEFRGWFSNNSWPPSRASSSARAVRGGSKWDGRLVAYRTYRGGNPTATPPYSLPRDRRNASGPRVAVWNQIAVWKSSLEVDQG